MTETPEWVPEADEGLSPEPQQNTIIESDKYPMRVLAGAGTGKTFTMVRKIEHLIDERNVSPDRILALTFTNNAANSMREKLNAKLGTAGYDIDAYTYHSICNEILSEYAYEAGIDPEFEVVSEAEKYSVVLEGLDEIEYRTVKPNVYGPDSKGSGAASNLLSYISKMKSAGVPPEEVDAFLGSAERLYEMDDIPGRIEEAASDSLGGRSVSTVLDGIPDIRDVLVEERRRLGDSGVETSVKRFLDHLLGLCDSLEAAFEEHENGERDLPENVHKLPKYLFGGYASGAPSGIPSMNMELTGLLEDYLDDCKTARDLNAGYAAYEEELEERNLLDFDDLVSKTVELLDMEVADEISSRWDYVFCDEFQDTDRLQFDLVTSLVSEDRLFVVGDDDQAIYEWRGARVANITDELDEYFDDALEDEPLEDNFRSRQPILDLANEALKILRGDEGKTLERVEEPEYEGDTVALVSEAEEGEDRSEQALTVVKNLLSGEADELDEEYDPGDLAILVRKKKHAKPILERFNEEGVPYQVAGGVSSDSIGVGTVVAFLKALARPEEDEVSWNRVLTMRYRLHDEDLRRLNGHEDGLLAALFELPPERFNEPERVADAREDIEHLLDLRDRVSLGYLYREIKQVTNVEWYLSEQDRRNLAQLDEIVGEYGDGTVQPSLSDEFIEALRRQETVLEGSGSTPTSQPELSEDAVNVMTIHKSKGLDFPVVMMPRLTADEWDPSSRTYDAVEEALIDAPEKAFEEDFVQRDVHESRRLLHVGITRAEDILILQGGSDEDEGVSDIEEFTESVMSGPWNPSSHRFPVWDDILDSLPSTAADWTDSLASRVFGSIGGSIVDGEDSLQTEAARKRVLDLARSSVDGDTDTEPGEGVFEVESLTGPSKPYPAIRHSYTSLETYKDCSRQHYLDYVVNAFSDHTTGTNKSDADGVSQREIGLLFHDTAEIAAQDDVTDIGGWYDICERLAGQKRAQDALDAAKECIDRYFDLEISSWEVIDAEREFALEVDGHEFVGLIDAVYKTPEDELVVIDYKATDRERDLNKDKQLPIYLLACRDLYDEPVRRAGYAYVGGIGPKLDDRTFENSELESVLSEVSTSINRISETSFEEYTSGDHCRWCQHNQLPCAPDSTQ